ncbi:MAG TPA: hypothetical protein VHC41_01810 [Mycobacteriales bacterium]|jgi:hypothetical protein|nr:hypothetical protein [Mycobacteriales bacterium]
MSAIRGIVCGTRRRLAFLFAVAIAIPLLLLCPSRAAAGTTNYFWFYGENTSQQYDARLELVGNYTGTVFWSAHTGSGLPGYFDDCVTNKGWIPAGTGAITGYSYNYPGTSVVGPVLILANRPCHTGAVIRTELFVHSKYPWVPNNYQTNGCIKSWSTGTPSTAGGAIREIVDYHVSYGQPQYLVVGPA